MCRKNVGNVSSSMYSPSLLRFSALIASYLLCVACEEEEKELNSIDYERRLHHTKASFYVWIRVCVHTWMCVCVCVCVRTCKSVAAIIIEGPFHSGGSYVNVQLVSSWIQPKVHWKFRPHERKES